LDRPIPLAQYNNCTASIGQVQPVTVAAAVNIARGQCYLSLFSANFCQFEAKNWHFLENQCHDHFVCKKQAVFRVKNANFLSTFWQKYF
jgi:hypothetical protein